MSLEDSSKKSAAKCHKEFDIIHEQLLVLLEKMDILFPTGKKIESSKPENKSETETKKKVVAPLPAVTPEEIGEGYKDLEESIKGFIKPGFGRGREGDRRHQPGGNATFISGRRVIIKSCSSTRRRPGSAGGS